MKWIYPVKIIYLLSAVVFIFNISGTVSQSLRDYRYFDNDRYSYYNHPAVRRAKYLLGGTNVNSQPKAQAKSSEKRLINSYNTRNAITDQNAYKNQNTDYKGYDNRELQRYARRQEVGKAVSDNISQADKENAKFEGANNQESENDAESSRALGALKLQRLARLLRSRCLPFGRNLNDVEDNTIARSTDQYGRFLWDLNVYNVYGNSPAPHQPAPMHNRGCAGLLSSVLGGGLFSDPLPPPPPVYPTSPLTNFLGLYAPGVLQNALAATAPPIPAAVNDQNLQNDPNVDPGYFQPQQQQPFPQQPFPQQPFPQQPQFPVRPFPQRPQNQIFFDAGPPPLTPSQLVGGIATTVNGIIQQLTGNVQPVYQQPFG